MLEWSGFAVESGWWAPTQFGSFLCVCFKSFRWLPSSTSSLSIYQISNRQTEFDVSHWSQQTSHFILCLLKQFVFSFNFSSSSTRIHVRGTHLSQLFKSHLIFVHDLIWKSCSIFMFPCFIEVSSKVVFKLDFFYGEFVVIWPCLASFCVLWFSFSWTISLNSVVFF